MTEKNSARNEEIDLFRFLKPVIDIGREILLKVRYHFVSLYKLRIPALVVFLLIAAVGYTLRYWMPKAYKTEGLFVSHVLPSSYCSMMIQQLNMLAASGNNSGTLSQHLAIPETVVADISSIALAPVPDTMFGRLNDTLFSVFKIEMILQDMKNLDVIQKGIIHYLEENDYAVKRKIAKKQSLVALKEVMDARIKSLDTLKQLVNNSIEPRSKGTGIILGQPLNPVVVYEAERNFYDAQLKINEDLAVIDNIEIIHPFFKRNDYNFPDFTSIFYQFVICGIIVSLIATPFIFSRLLR